MSLENNTLFLSNLIIDTLDTVTQRFVVQLPLILTILGLIGFIGNAFTFLQATLRWNTFCIYSLCGSLVDILNIFINLFPNYIGKTAGNLVTAVSVNSLCKCKIFALVFLPQLSMHLLILSLIDRYICTCSLTSPMRHFRQLKMVPWLISITVILTCFISMYPIILYDIVPGVGCSSTQPLIDGVLYIVIQGIMPPMVMIVFVWLTYRNTRQSRRRVGVVTTGNQGRLRNQFIGMIFVQVFFTNFLVIQWVIMYLYFLITPNDSKSAEQWAIIYFVLSLSNNLYYVINVKSFFLSTLTSRLFRTTLVNAALKLVSRCRLQR